jgi:hypothetical protein
VGGTELGTGLLSKNSAQLETPFGIAQICLRHDMLVDVALRPVGAAALGPATGLTAEFDRCEKRSFGAILY